MVYNVNDLWKLTEMLFMCGLVISIILVFSYADAVYCIARRYRAHTTLNLNIFRSTKKIMIQYINITWERIE